jgi:glyoxylase-like metal-dependent hydrolase (beta-lactamase superfamily II)
MNMWLDTAPRSQVAYGALGVAVSLNDLCDRPPRSLEDGEVLDLGGKRVRQIPTPHVPHGWEAQVMFEETTGTLLCGDLFTHAGAPPALTSSDIIGPSIEAEELFRSTALAPHTGRVIRDLAELRPNTLAIMHGSSYRGDGRQALLDLAGVYEEMVATATVPA